jgi:hypothetical protein
VTTLDGEPWQATCEFCGEVFALPCLDASIRAAITHAQATHADKLHECLRSTPTSSVDIRISWPDEN